MLSIIKSFEMFSKHERYGFTSKSFDLNWYIFTSLSYIQKSVTADAVQT